MQNEKTSNDFPEEIPSALKQVKEEKERRAGKYPLPVDELDIISNVSDQLPGKVTSPLDEPVINNQRDNPQIIGLDTVNPINEPTVKNPVVTQPIPNLPSNKEIKKENAKGWDTSKQYATKSLGEKEPGTAPTNPAATTMTPKEEKEALKMSVETAIYIYGKAKMFIGEFFVTSSAKMRSMERAKKIKLDWAVDYDEATNQPFTFREFILETNKKIIKACETSDEFKKKIQPVLEAEFAKRGWVLSYQQNLMFMVGQDLFETAQKLFMIHKGMNDAIKRIQAEVKEFQADGGISSRQMYNMRNTMFVPHRTPVDNSVDPAFNTNGTPFTQWPTTQINEPIPPPPIIQEQKPEIKQPVQPIIKETAETTEEKKVVFSAPPEE